MFTAALCTLAVSAAPPDAAEPPASTVAATGSVLIADDFERSESDDAEEQVGGGWSTNSRSRAQGEKQVDLDGGAMHITRHAVADHGVSVRHDAEFRDGTISLRFRLPPGGGLGVDVADVEEKSVHAGHLFVVKVKPKSVELRDHKTGLMNEPIRARRLADETTAADRQLLKRTVRRFPAELETGAWHDLRITVDGDRLAVAIDGTTVGELRSPGIAHPTKRMIRLAVDREAWVDDVRVSKAAE